MINLDIPKIRNQIINKGYYVINNLFSKNEIETFRENISHEIKKSSKFNYRINSHNIEDYSHMRSHDSIERTIRYYMFFHNSNKLDALYLKKSSAGFSINSYAELIQIIDNLNDMNFYKGSSKNAMNYVVNHRGSTQKILELL